AGDVIAGSTPDALALNVDLAPTIAEAVGVAAPGAEGRSLLPMLRGDPEASPRQEFLVEHLAGTNPVPTYCAVRSRDWVYVRYTDGQEELYDLRADPAQLRNLAAEPSASGRLEERRTRLDELCDPPPPGFGDSGLDARLAAGVAAMLALVVLGAVAGARRVRRPVPS
ncbi:MAG TPA: sulfatase/phosphatase domain-containing protein, partial [Actinomycetota bacterium]|nr:sulfatase/phosphatase domain-containing protein [Actinomycetota bacterium]